MGSAERTTVDTEDIAIRGKARSERPSRDSLSAALLLLTALNCAFQIGWFWRLTHNNINFDAISYIGIARHLVGRDVHASLNGYWSPLISWLIASASIFSSNLTLPGHVITIASFLLCLLLLYFLTYRLWRSRLLAAVAVLWFSLSRGVAVSAVSFIGADFLLTGLTLLYFIQILECIHTDRVRGYFVLGLPQGVAFLAKSIALPWLSLSTLVACCLRGPRRVRPILLRFAVALVIPLLIWLGWGTALKSKYGSFTAGYQLRANLFDSETQMAATRNPEYRLLRDYSRATDSLLVLDIMYPGSPLWNRRLEPRSTLSLVLRKEVHNIPIAAKELTILVTPGGMIALALAVIVLWKRRAADTEAATFAIVVLFSAVALILAYCMLVFDGRYVLPITPLVIAVAVGFILPWHSPAVSEHNSPMIKNLSLAAFVLVVGSVAFFQIYWSSPLRTLRRDFQSSCYDAARKLKNTTSCRRVVAIGEGPYPEHGVGWEAGFYSSYFAGCRLAGFAENFPMQAQAGELIDDIRKSHADTLLLFSSPSNPRYRYFRQLLAQAYPELKAEPVFDPTIGNVGEAISGLSTSQNR
jgi:hypothetical protein